MIFKVAVQGCFISRMLLKASLTAVKLNNTAALKISGNALKILQFAMHQKLCGYAVFCRHAGSASETV